MQKPSGMTEAIDLTQPTDRAASVADPQDHPAGTLTNLIVGYLAPLFLPASRDLYSARMAALATVNAYHPRDALDLMAIAQIIACGLSALGALSLAMAGDLPVDDAASARQCRRAEPRRRTEPPHFGARAAGRPHRTPLSRGAGPSPRSRRSARRRSPRRRLPSPPRSTRD